MAAGLERGASGSCTNMGRGVLGLTTVGSSAAQGTSLDSKDKEDWKGDGWLGSPRGEGVERGRRDEGSRFSNTWLKGDDVAGAFHQTRCRRLVLLLSLLFFSFPWLLSSFLGTVQGSWAAVGAQGRAESRGGAACSSFGSW